MQYHVEPFTANIVAGQGSGAAAQQLSQLINQRALEGWEYVRLESVSTIVTTPANNGCMGIGATPASSVQIEVYMAVFRQG